MKESDVHTEAVFRGSTIGIDGPPSPTRSAYSGIPLRAAVTDDYELLVAGRPSFRGTGDSVPEGPSSIDGFCEQFAAALALRGKACLGDLAGRYAIAVRGRRESFLLLVADRFASIPVFYAKHGDGYVFAESTVLLPDELRSTRRIAAQAVYNYLYFHVVPIPDSMYVGVSALPPAGYLWLEPSRRESGTHWMPDFREQSDLDFVEQSEELKSRLRRAVQRYSHDGNVGCFLSGGLDSSTVLGYLSEVGDDPARAFTIGFDAPEYDETAYARAAAEHFGAQMHDYRVTPSDILESIRTIARTYDAPFGNSSALPTLFCARFARTHGINTLLAGDGGDELFAGNARYAKQKIFEYYYRLPGALRTLAIDRLGRPDSLFARAPGLSKVNSYIRQALVPLPDRLETYNYLHRFPAEAMFCGDFLKQVDIDYPLRLLRDRYDQPADASTLNRMLYTDWKFTLTDNDLRKVARMCQVAGVNVEFPLLDDDLVDFSTSVPSKIKLPGTRLRHFFRESMKDFLPDVVLQKRKHGFGLPFGIWLVEVPELRSFAYSSLSNLEQRGIFRTEFIASLKESTEQEHAAYYGEMIWVMIMLEEWLAAHH